MFGLPFLLPYLRRTEGLTLAQGGALVAAPSLGMVVTFIAWGAFADRYGERLAIALGLGLTGVLWRRRSGERPGRPGRALRTRGGGWFSLVCDGCLDRRPVLLDSHAGVRCLITSNTALLKNDLTQRFLKAQVVAPT